MCQILITVVKVDKRGTPKLIEVKLDTGEVVAFTFPDRLSVVGPLGLFGGMVVLDRLDPLIYDELLFGSVKPSGSVS